jgi:hypothetical protein
VLKKILVLTVLTGLLGTAGVALADPNITSNVPKHRHFIEKDGLRVEVGPRLCDNPNLQGAFNQFHVNLHSHLMRTPTGSFVPVVGAIGPIAPGLHTGPGPELHPGPC